MATLNKEDYTESEWLSKGIELRNDVEQAQKAHDATIRRLKVALLGLAFGIMSAIGWVFLNVVGDSDLIQAITSSVFTLVALGVTIGVTGSALRHSGVTKWDDSTAEDLHLAQQEQSKWQEIDALSSAAFKEPFISPSVRKNLHVPEDATIISEARLKQLEDVSLRYQQLVKKLPDDYFDTLTDGMGNLIDVIPTSKTKAPHQWGCSFCQDFHNFVDNSRAVIFIEKHSHGGQGWKYVTYMGPSQETHIWLSSMRNLGAWIIPKGDTFS